MEIVSENADEEVAYREGLRYVPVLQRVRTSALSPSVPVRLRPDASYLVTGGWGNWSSGGRAFIGTWSVPGCGVWA